MYEIGINGDFEKSKKSSLKNFLAQNKLLVFLSTCLLLGVFCGSMLVKVADENTLNSINILFSRDIQERATKSSLEIFITSLSSTAFFLVISFFMGLSLHGFALVPLVPFSRGLCIGMSEVYLYSSYGLKGLGLHSLVFLPGLFISSLAILLSTQEAFRMSNKLSTSAFFKNNLDISFELKRYFVRNGGILLFTITASLVDLMTAVLSSRL